MCESLGLLLRKASGTQITNWSKSSYRLEVHKFAEEDEEKDKKKENSNYQSYASFTNASLRKKRRDKFKTLSDEETLPSSLQLAFSCQTCFCLKPCYKILAAGLPEMNKQNRHTKLLDRDS